MSHPASFNGHQVFIHLHFRQNLPSVLDRHFQVKQQKVNFIFMAAQRFQGLGAIRRARNIVVLPKQIAHDFTVDLHIIGDQDMLAGVDHGTVFRLRIAFGLIVL